MDRRTFTLVILASLAIGCGGGRAGQSSAPATPEGSGVVVRGSELSGNLLDALRTRVPTMMVSHQGGMCPNIMFRGPRSIRNQGNPSVYVDGTLMIDTCILTQITSSDVDYVEIFPSGLAARPGVQQNPFGLILVHRVRE